MSNFNGIAPYYDLLARMVFGNKLIRAQNTFLHAIPPRSSVLIMGGGTGRILIDLLKIRSEVQVCYLEASTKMVNLSRKRLQQEYPEANVTFMVAAELPSFKEKLFHVILTPFVLDVFDERQLKDIFRQLHAALVPEGLWLWTDFEVPEGKLKWPARLLIRSMYVFFNVLCQVKAQKLPPVDRFFAQYGLELMEGKSYLGGILRSRQYKKI